MRFTSIVFIVDLLLSLSFSIFALLMLSHTHDLSENLAKHKSLWVLRCQKQHLRVCPSAYVSACVCVFVHLCAVHVNHRPPVGGESFSKRVASAIMGYRWGDIVCCAHCVVGFC